MKIFKRVFLGAWFVFIYGLLFWCLGAAGGTGLKVDFLPLATFGFALLVIYSLFTVMRNIEILDNFPKKFLALSPIFPILLSMIIVPSSNVFATINDRPVKSWGVAVKFVDKIKVVHLHQNVSVSFFEINGPVVSRGIAVNGSAHAYFRMKVNNEDILINFMRGKDNPDNDINIMLNRYFKDKLNFSWDRNDLSQEQNSWQNNWGLNLLNLSQ